MVEVRDRHRQEDQVPEAPDHRIAQVQGVQAVQEVQVQQGHDEILYLYINILIIHFRLLYNDKSPGS